MTGVAEHPLVAAMVAMAAVFFVQFVVADVAGIRAGHVPGMPVASGHDDFFFRAARAQANTNESLPLFVLLCVAAMMAGASPTWSSYAGWGFVAGRVGHMAAYYADLRTLRSVMFGVATLSLVILLVVTALALG
jgi:uncharacterized MAPEG superfamily protein